MNNKFFASVFLILGVVAWSQFTGCKKGGPVIPYDIPWPTPTPVTGDITAGVIDNGSPVAGVTVFAVDPFGTTLTAVTDSFGLAAFSPAVLSVGNWTMEVPTQGRYYFSSLPLAVSGGGNNSVTFQAGGQTISATPVSAETYGSSNTDISYNIAYSQPFNLKVPVVLSSTGLPVGWVKDFQPVTIGTSVVSSNATITKNGCYFLNYPFSFDAKDLMGGAVDSKSATISRGYPVPVAVQISSGSAIYNPQKTYFGFDVSLSSSNDCNYAYPINLILYTTNYVAGGPITHYNQSFNFINGGSRSYAVTTGTSNYNQVNYGHIVLTLTGPVNQFTGSLTTSASFSGIPINSNY